MRDYSLDSILVTKNVMIKIFRNLYSNLFKFIVTVNRYLKLN